MQFYAKFTHCCVGHVSSVHDAKVFQTSALANYIEAPNEYFPFDTHIVANAAYAIHPYVMVPFRDEWSSYSLSKKFQLLFVLN